MNENDPIPTLTPPKKSNTLIIVLVVALVAVPVIVFVIGVLAAIAIPSFIKYTKKSKTAEVAAHLGVLRSAVVDHCETQGALPGSAGPVPSTPGRQPQTGDFASDPVFSSLSFAPATPVYFSYRLEPQAGGELRLIAEGDLDGDGVKSEFAYVCEPDPCTCSVALEIRDEFE